MLLREKNNRKKNGVMIMVYDFYLVSHRIESGDEVCTQNDPRLEPYFPDYSPQVIHVYTLKKKKWCVLFRGGDYSMICLFQDH